MQPILRRASRGSLLAGAATVLALAFTTTPAAAQSGASATGRRTLINQQAVQGSDQLAFADNATLGSTSPTTTDGIVRVDDNNISLSARGNQANGTLGSDSLDTAYPGIVDLHAGLSGVSADGALVIANRQSASNTVTGTNPLGTRISIAGGAVTRSTLSATGNTEQGSATANGAVDTITATNDGGGGAGIASYQSMDSRSEASGRAAGTMDVLATSLSSSSIANTGNVMSGVGTGNDLAASVSVKVGAVDTSTPLSGPVVMTAVSDDPLVTAQYGILGNQSGAGLIKGRAGASDDGPAFHVGVSDVAVDSSIANDGNRLIAAAYGNNGANSLAVGATSIASPAGVTVGDLSDQQAFGGRVTAFTIGSNAVDLGTGVAGSSVSASGNTARAAAAGNLAGDSMAVTTVSADTRTAAPANALTTSHGGAALDAAFGVQNVQDFGTSTVSAMQIHGTTLVGAGGMVRSSAIKADDNLRTVAASGNSATTGLTLSGDDLTTTAAVNLVQSGNGGVTASVGTMLDVAGNRMSATGISDSATSVSSNSATATALGNDGTTSLSVTGDKLASTPGAATAGTVDAGYGATGGYIVAANQKLGAPDLAGGVLPIITSTVVDRSGIAVAGIVASSSLTIDGNAQRANAIGNTGTNHLDVSANMLDPSATSALSSSQYGQATIAATSNQNLTVPGTLYASSASLSNNSNIAYAAVNIVDNGMTVKGQGTVDGSIVSLSSGQMGPPEANGDALLANQQFAIGTLDANASSKLGNTGAADHLTSSQLTVSGNNVLADASANRALNAVSLTGATAGGIVNTQISAASVHAVATSDARFTASGTGASLQDAALTFGGNMTSATARGNAADNSIAYAAATGAGAVAGGRSAWYLASATAPVALLNSQANMAAVTADTGTSDVLAPLNGAVTGSTLAFTGNTSSATAYGNSASNVMAVSAVSAAPAASLVNSQTNSGAVSASVTGGAYRGLLGPVGGSSVGVTGNQLAASATGNLAVGSVTTSR